MENNVSNVEFIVGMLAHAGIVAFFLGILVRMFASSTIILKEVKKVDKASKNDETTNTPPADSASPDGVFTLSNLGTEHDNRGDEPPAQPVLPKANEEWDFDWKHFFTLLLFLLTSFVLSMMWSYIAPGIKLSSENGIGFIGLDKGISSKVQLQFIIYNALSGLLALGFVFGFVNREQILKELGLGGPTNSDNPPKPSGQ
jgi:hypothetical protein